MIPTAEEFIMNNTSIITMAGNKQKVKEAMITFAKLHVEAFRQDLIDNHVEVWDDCNVTPTTSILNAYPLTDIK